MLDSATAVKKTILLVPGFMADTYDSEEWFVELCSKTYSDIQFLWLVPDASYLFKCKRFWHPDSPKVLSEPVYVTHLKENNTPYLVRNIRKYNFVANFILFRRLFKDTQIDAVYTHFGPERFWATLFGKLWGKTTIWSEHWHSLGRRFAVAKRIFYLLFVDYFISGSRFIAETLPKGAKVYTVPNSMRLEGKHRRLEEEQRFLLKEKLGLPPSSTIILMVANFTKQKRHALALEVCEKVIGKRKDVVFVFPSEGPERERIVRKIAELNLNAHFVLPGYVSKVDEYYQAADICMFTAFNDAAPLVILEAMKYSLPQVVFASGGPAEVIRHGETGFLAREGDVNEFSRQLLELIDDSAKRSLMGEKALQVMRENYSLDTWTKNMMTVLREIVLEKRNIRERGRKQISGGPGG